MERESDFILNTMGLFSGDGTGCTARILKQYGTTVLGGLQIKMPDSVCDSRLLKKNTEENRRIVREADKRIALAAEQSTEGKLSARGIVDDSAFQGFVWTETMVLSKDGGIHGSAENKQCMHRLRLVQ